MFEWRAYDVKQKSDKNQHTRKWKTNMNISIESSIDIDTYFNTLQINIYFMRSHIAGL